MLRALAGGSSIRKDILILSPKGSYEKPTFKKTKGEHITSLRMEKFFVSKGLRKAYEKQYIPGTDTLWIVDGKQVYKEIKPENSKYETSVRTMYTILFGDEDIEANVKKMWSFTGIVELMATRLDKKSIKDTFERLLDLSWGPAGQKLERDYKDIDYDIKMNAVNYMIKQIPMLKSYEGKIEKMVKTFYDNYDKKKMSEAILHTGNDFKDFLNEMAQINNISSTNPRKSDLEFYKGEGKQFVDKIFDNISSKRYSILKTTDYKYFLMTKEGMYLGCIECSSPDKDDFIRINMVHSELRSGFYVIMFRFMLSDKKVKGILSDDNISKSSLKAYNNLSKEFSLFDVMLFNTKTNEKSDFNIKEVHNNGNRVLVTFNNGTDAAIEKLDEYYDGIKDKTLSDSKIHFNNKFAHYLFETTIAHPQNYLNGFLFGINADDI